MNRLEGAILALASLTALAVGLGILTVPMAFYGSYGIDPTLSPSLANELRSPGAAIGILGIFLGLAVVAERWRLTGLVVSAAFYLAYAGARAVSVVLDGVPSTALFVAGAFELALGLAAASMLVLRRRLRVTS